MTGEASAPRGATLQTALRLEYLTVGWNTVEGLVADAFQTTACFWLSLITLSGIGLNAAFAWWWADPAGCSRDDVVHRQGGCGGVA